MCGMVKMKSLSRLNPYIREVNMHLELYPPPFSNTNGTALLLLVRETIHEVALAVFRGKTKLKPQTL